MFSVPFGKPTSMIFPAYFDKQHTIHSLLLNKFPNMTSYAV